VGLLLSLIEGLAGIVVSFVGAMNSIQLTALGQVIRRWLSRIALALWPDVKEPDEPQARRRPPPAR
jgi:hypothetical protein